MISYITLFVLTILLYCACNVFIAVLNCLCLRPIGIECDRQRRISNRWLCVASKIVADGKIMDGFDSRHSMITAMRYRWQMRPYSSSTIYQCICDEEKEEKRILFLHTHNRHLDLGDTRFEVR